MSKVLRFVLVSIVSFCWFSGAFAVSGYNCPTIKKFTDCAAGYYLNDTSVGNDCVACPSGSGWTSTTIAGSDGWHKSTACDCPKGYINESNGTTAVVSGQTCSIVTYNISYVVPEGATNSSENPKTYTVKTLLTMLKPATKDGYDFDGWYSDAGFKQSVYSIGGGEIGEKTLYGKLTAKTYTATYACGDGATGAPEADQGTFDSSYTVKANTCVKPGYSFAGWSDGSKVVQPGEITWKYLDNTTFTAQWTACKSDPANPGSCNCEENTYPNGSGSCVSCVVSCSSESIFNKGEYNVCGAEPQTANQMCYRDCLTSDVENASTVTGTITKGGTNTCKATGCAADSYLSGNACPACEEGYSAPASSTSATACTKSCSVACIRPECPENSDTCEIGSETTSGTQNQVDKQCSAEAQTCSMTFTCKAGYKKSGNACVAETYTVTLNKQGGTGGDDSVQVTFNQAMPAVSVPAQAGYTFTGYFDKASGGVKYYTNTGASAKTWDKAGDTTLYAQWTPNAYTVSYSCGTGTGSAPESDSATFDTTYIPKENTCSPSGTSNFVGWKVSGTEDIKQPGSGFTWKYTENKTLTAQWENCTPCSPTNANCSVKVVDNVCVYTTSCKPGYGNLQNNGKYNPSCTANTYQAIYACGTGTGTPPAKESATYNATYNVKANTCKKPGYEFTYWNDGAKSVNVGDITWLYTSDTTFTAQWDACEANTEGAGTCGCSGTQYPNGSGCSNCTVSCSSVPTYNLGSYDVCNSQTDSVCYRNCTTSDVANSSTVSGTVTKAGTNTCKATACEENFYLSGSGCAACVPNATCPGGDEKFECNPGYHLSSDGRSCEPDEYDITLNKQGGSGDINGSTGTDDATQKCKHGEICNLPSEGLEKFGYAFTGWGDSAGCTSGKYQMTFTAAKTIYACWSQQTTSCEAGKHYTGTEHETCPTMFYCPGEGYVNIGSEGCSESCPAGASGSTPGSTAATGCYKTCQPKTIDGGTATVVKAQVFYTGSAYPECTYTVSCNEGYKASGNNTANPSCTKCADGEYCPGGAVTEPEECEAGYYCEEGLKTQCPDGGTSIAGASDVTQCFKTCPEPGTIENGTLENVQEQTYYTGSTYPACTFKAICDENYVAQNSPGLSPTCVWADPDACPEDHYCPDGEPKPIACPDGGKSEAGSKDVSACYKIFDPYEGFTHGTASAKCFWFSSNSEYDRACSTIEVKTCDAGYWYENTGAPTCSSTKSGFYSPEGDTKQIACPVDPAGGEVRSSENADSFTDCLKDCKLEVTNSTSVAAKENTVNGISEDAYAACSFSVTCETGYTVQNNNTETPSCKANEYTITLNKNGGSGDVADSVQCTFDSKNCALPAVSSLTRPGYTVVSKWCSDRNGGSPCYNAGESISTNISANGTDTTLYAVWTPNVYTVNLDHQDADVAGSPETVYLKYATGWYSDADAMTKITKLVQNPSKDGYTFTGYGTSAGQGVTAILSDGSFSTSEEALTITTSSPATLYAKWSAGSTSCEAGTYYTGTATECKQCKENYYCPGGSFGTDSGHEEGLNKCPDGGLSVAGATSATQCYKTGLEYTATNGSGTQRCYYDVDDSLYSASCDTKVITSCKAGYYLSDSGNIDCDSVGTGYYSGAAETERHICPNSGTTASENAKAVQECFKTNLPYNAVYGDGTQRCFYSNGEGSSAVYQRECDTQVITSCRGGYYLSEPSNTDCDPVGKNYYSPTGDTERHACEDGGETRTETSDSIQLCFKAGQEYTGTHGKGHRVCFYNSGTGIYDFNCETPTMTYCDAGYYYNVSTKPDDCIEAGIGYYSQEGVTNREQCPSNGLTKTKISASAAECYLEQISCDILNGQGEHTCNYDEAKQDYSASCTTCTVTSCDEGFSQVGNTCVNCPEDHVCEGGTQKTCSELTDNQYPHSDAGTNDKNMCYADCTMAENAVSMTGRDYFGAPDTCKIARCKVGFYLENNACVTCPAGSFCDGTEGSEGGNKSCADLGDGSWKYSDEGSADESKCYRMCESYPLVGGIAIPVNAKEYWPNDCQFRGETDEGEPCDIVDGECVVSQCKPSEEMINGKCQPCDREHAVAYKPGGNCIVASCELGWHPKGQRCEPDVIECSAPNATVAKKTWDSRTGMYGPCMIRECEPDFHVVSNACVRDVQACAIENGTGVKEWNDLTNSWGECEVVSCKPGYTDDPYESSEPSKQCGMCKNWYSVLGEIAASGFVRGCEIASCLYQGEKYSLENNECVPICEDREDETGSMRWDATRKKCVRTCNEGYTMW